MAKSFLRGIMPIRHTKFYLEKADIVLQDQVHILCIGFNKRNPAHKGADDFIFWHWGQLQYRNMDVQMLKYVIRSPTPFIQVFLDSGEEIMIDIDGYDRSQIYERVKRVLGKTQLVLETESAAKASIENPANFGPKSARQCMCEVEGQQPCTGVVFAPKYMQGKWRWNKNII